MSSTSEKQGIFEQESYEVGYCKPPVRTRFQKGKSGNPRGFPKGQQKLCYVLRRFLAMPLEQFEEYEPRTITEALAKQLIETASNGDDRASLRAAKFICDRTEGKVR
jgi:hypothetical protein